MAQVIEKEFQVDWDNSEDKRVTDPDRFGYSSLHYVVEFKSERLEFIEYKEFTGVKFEIQIRSILQHAWAEIEHDLGYKSKNEVPKEIRRDFSRIAGLLEIADNEFIRIKDFLKNYRQEIETKIESQSLEIPIDKDSMMEYLNKSQVISDILENIYKEFDIEHIINNPPGFYYLDALRYFDINEISQLDKMLNENKDKIIIFYKRWMRARDVRSIARGIPVFFLFYVLIYEDYSDEKLDGYCDLMFKDETKISVKETFKELLEENLLS